MRIRALIPFALLALAVAPAIADAQRIPRPRIGRGAPPTTAPLPPQSPTVARDLALKRSRWSVEGYPIISVLQVPSGTGGVASYSTFGTGAHADYRYSDHFAATIDATSSTLGGTATDQTIEFGARLRPLAPGALIRPFVDVRGAYLHMVDTYASAANPLANAEGAVVEGEQYSNGVGAVAGVGFDYTITRSMAFFAEGSAMRNQMHTYRWYSGSSVPAPSNYWLTGYRLTMGVTWNPVRALRSDASRTR